MATAPLDALQIEREKIELEREKLKVELKKTIWTAVGAVIPIFVALGTIIYGVWSLRETAMSQFTTKVAELALAAPDPNQAKNRARILALWFKESLPGDFNRRLEEFKPEEFGTFGEDTPSKKELFQAIAEHPDKRADLIETWEALFPSDEWTDSLHSLSGVKPSKRPKVDRSNRPSVAPAH